jgi:hypothetical protein
MRQLAIAIFLAGAARLAMAQGGPPMITDDPGTPGNGHWENNFSITFEHRPNEWLIDAPGIDLNYGVGEHIQLNLQTALTILKRSDHGGVAGLSGTELAVKWRFLDEDKAGVDMSMYPRIIFNVAQSSVRRGLSEPGTRFQIPFQLAKKFGPFGLDCEFGPLASTVGRSEFLYGIVGGVEVSKKTSIMAEVAATSRMNFDQQTVTLNVGWRHKISEHCIWIASVGHEVRSPADDQLALVGYCGAQLVY